MINQRTEGSGVIGKQDETIPHARFGLFPLPQYFGLFALPALSFRQKIQGTTAWITVYNVMNQGVKSRDARDTFVPRLHVESVDGGGGVDLQQGSDARPGVGRR